jgi:hypothetical protein
MIQTINFYAFEQAFRNYDRFDNFGYDGLRILFEYLEQYEEDTGEQIDLDVVALCCDYSHSTVAELIQDYNITPCDSYGEPLAADDVDGLRECVRDYLNENTTVCGETDDGFVYANF